MAKLPLLERRPRRECPQFQHLCQNWAMNRKKLPVGVQTLHEIREEGYYYVDKTGLAVQLAEQGKYYFLSAPALWQKFVF